MNRKLNKVIMTGLFLIWFLGSIFFLMEFGSKENYGLALVTFGQFFLVFGINATKGIFNTKEISIKNLLLLMVPIIGVVVIIIGLGINFNVEAIKKYSILSLPLLFFVVGMLGLVNILRLRIKCNYRINSKIIGENKIPDSDGNYGYHTTPVYEINYNNKIITICDEIYSYMDYEIGEERELLINPNNPIEFIDLKRKHISFYIISIGSMISGILSFTIILGQI